MRKATASDPNMRGSVASHVVTDPAHAPKHFTRKPGDPRFGPCRGMGPRRESERSKTAMNEPGKSDKSVVPSKPANLDFWQFMKSLEPVEGRGLAKENGEGVADALLPVDPAKRDDRTQRR